MPPKRKTGSFFSGTGRVLGSGEEKPTKRPRKNVREDDDADYVPPTSKRDDFDDDDADYVPNERKGPTKTRHAEEDTAVIRPADAQVRTTRERAREQITEGARSEGGRQSRYGGRKAATKEKAKVDPEDGAGANDDYSDDEASKAIADIPLGTLRSGAGRGFYKYGQGQTLGEGPLEGQELKEGD